MADNIPVKPAMPKLSKADIHALLWEQGELSFLLHPLQRQMSKIIYDSPRHSKLVMLVGRQVGKSVLLCVLASEVALKKPYSIIKFVTDTGKHMKSITEPIFRELFETGLGDKAPCPEHIRPEYFETKGIYLFPNGSQIQLAGTDNKNYERLRGQKADMCLVDEAGFVNDMEDVIDGVLFPTTTHTGGRIVMASTPPVVSDHPFLKYMEQAQLDGLFYKKTLYDNPLLTQEEIALIEKPMGGKSSSRFRREYLCELIRSEDSVVIPEFTDDVEAEIVKEWDKPQFYTPYVSMDLGYHDLTAVLFAYHDFRADRIIIEDEMIIKGKDLKLPMLSKGILDKEKLLWSNPHSGELVKPFKRVSDINMIVTEEMSRMTNYELRFDTPKKDDKGAMVNQLRVLIGEKKIIINPRCETLIRHLKNARWATRKEFKQFDRSVDDGHYDAVDALIYMVRQIDLKKNPYPSSLLTGHETFIVSPRTYGKTDQVRVMESIFGRRKR